MTQYSQEKTMVRQTNSTNLCDLSKCPTCNGTGFIIQGEQHSGYPDGELIDYAYRCPSCNGGLAERVESLKKTSKIPVIYLGMKYESFKWNIYQDTSGNLIDMSKTRQLVESLFRNYREWKSEGMGLYIHSQTKGSGKSFLACVICNELMKKYGIKAQYIRASDVLNIAQSADKNSMNEYERDPIMLLGNCELLVLDDIGQKKTANEWLSDNFYRIIDARMSQNLVTIFTSNLRINELPLEETITDRIFKITYDVSLPEFDVRTRDAHTKKVKFLKKMGLVEDDDETI